MDRIRPETLAEIKKKEKAYPHEIRAMVAEMEAIRLDRPFVEPSPSPVIKPGMQVYDEMLVLAIPQNALHTQPRQPDSIKVMRVGETRYIEAYSGQRYFVWRAL